MENVDAGWRAPHSHVYAVTRQQLEDAGICVLADGVEAGVYAAVSQNPTEFLFLQGHPEYDANSLLKEFKREIQRFFDDVSTGFPRVPEHCFGDDAIETIAQFSAAVVAAKKKGGSLPDFPEERLAANLQNVWRTTGQRLFGNVLKLVHQAKCRT